MEGHLEVKANEAILAIVVQAEGQSHRCAARLMQNGINGFVEDPVPLGVGGHRVRSKSAGNCPRLPPPPSYRGEVSKGTPSIRAGFLMAFPRRPA